MGWWNLITDSSSTVDKIVDGVINTGDKLVFTAEEKADYNMKMREYFPTLLKAYEPFKIAQRVLAMWFSFLFGMSFLLGLGMTIFNIYLTYNYVPILNEAQEIINPLKLIELQPLFNIVEVFSLGIIMLAIISFYFAGGALESLKRSK